MAVIVIDYPNLHQKPEKRVLFLKMIYELVHAETNKKIDDINLKETDLKVFIKLLKTEYQEFFTIHNGEILKGEISGNLILRSNVLIEDIKKNDIIKNKNSIVRANDKVEDLFLKWLFKYSKIDYIPFSKGGLEVFKSIFKNIDENALKNILNIDILSEEIKSIPLRKNEISKRDSRLIFKFLKDIISFIKNESSENKYDNYWDRKLSKIEECFETIKRSSKKPPQIETDTFLVLITNPKKSINYQNKTVIFDKNSKMNLNVGDLSLCHVFNENETEIVLKQKYKINLKTAKKCLENKKISFIPSKNAIKELLLTYETFDLNGKIELWDHQKKAIRNWICNEKKGIFEMATGTGKTFTALGCLKVISKNSDSLVSVIGCPFNHLIHQWEKDLKSMKINHEIIIADSTNPKWKNQISNKILDINNKNKKFLTILTTHDTFSSPKFCNEIRKVKSDLFLIMDEVHGIGTPLRSKGLLDNYTYRLGLSATPERWFDKKGTKLIKDFFSETVYKFPLNKAINTINVNTGKTYLTPYEYKPYFVELNDSELMEYKKITKKIVKAYFGSKKEDSLNISSLYFKRQKIINEALNKLKVLKNIIRENKLEHCLVYCSSKQIKPIQEILNQKGIVQHKFTMKEGIKKSDEFGGESERGLILKKFSEGFYKVLVAIKCLDEGVDIPSAKIAIIMSSTSNPIQYIQRRGRILRRSYNKEKAVIYDMIVIPGFDILKDDYIRDFELKIIRKEFQRYKEFALSADNALECLKLLEDMELKYDLSL